MKNVKFKKYFPIVMLILIGLFVTAASFGAAVMIGGSLALSPVWGVISEGTFKVLSAEQVEGLDATEKLKYYNALNEYREKQILDLTEKSKTLKGEAVQEAVKEIFKLREDFAKERRTEMLAVQKTLDEMGIAIKRINSSHTKSEETLKDFLGKENVKKSLVGIIKGGSNDLLIIKANTLTTSITDRPEYYDTNIGQLNSRRLFFWDLFPKIKLPKDSSNIVKWYEWDAATTVRAAAAIAEGEDFPASTAKWEKKTEELKKIGDTIPVSDEFESDMGAFAAELAMFLQINVNIKVDDELYSGSGTGTHLGGVYTKAIAWTAGSARTDDANIYDLVVHVRSSIVSGSNKYLPDFVAMNAADILKYKLKKDGQHNYVFPPFVTQDGKIIDGMRVIESGKVTANTLLVGDSRFANIFYKAGYVLSRGTVDKQFIEDMLTLKGARRLLLRIKTNDLSAFRKVEDITAELLTLSS